MMGNSENMHPTMKGEEWQFCEYRDMRSSFWVPDRHPSHLLEFYSCQTKWRLGKIFAERQFHDYDEKYKARISEVSATCLATQMEGPSIGMEAILKIRQQSVQKELLNVSPNNFSCILTFRETGYRPMLSVQGMSAQRISLALNDVNSACGPPMSSPI